MASTSAMLNEVRGVEGEGSRVREEVEDGEEENRGDDEAEFWEELDKTLFWQRRT